MFKDLSYASFMVIDPDLDQYQILATMFKIANESKYVQNAEWNINEDTFFKFRVVSLALVRLSLLAKTPV